MRPQFFPPARFATKVLRLDFHRVAPHAARIPQAAPALNFTALVLIGVALRVAVAIALCDDEAWLAGLAHTRVAGGLAWLLCPAAPFAASEAHSAWHATGFIAALVLDVVAMALLRWIAIRAGVGYCAQRIAVGLYAGFPPAILGCAMLAPIVLLGPGLILAAALAQPVKPRAAMTRPASAQ